MEIKKITWEDKVAIEDLSDIEEINKVTAANINEIKDVINSNGDFTTDEINKLQTSIDETNTNVETANNGIATNASAIAGLEQKHTQQQSAIDANTANISSLNTSVAGIQNNINDINTSLNETNQKVNTKQDILTAGNGLQLLNNLISIQEQLLNKWNGYQTLIQTNQGDIASNTNEISTLQNDVNGISKLIQQIIEGLKQFPVFEIVGEWASGTAYRKNQAVYHNNKLWNSKINNNRTEPAESNTDWFLISKFDVDLSNYVTQNNLTNALRLKQDVLTGTSGITISQQTNEVGIDNNLLTKWNGYENLIQANQTNINGIQNKADANESEINRINGIVTTNTSNITDLQNKTNTNQTNITANQTNITTLENRYNTLNSEVVKLAGDQTITGAKTFDNQVLIRKDGTPLIMRAVNPGKIYMLIKGADDTTNFSLGANSSNTSLEVNRGDLTIKTMQANKNIAFENAARIKFNRSVLEMGTEINAGFGGGEVKFIPEDNSTKTLKFYNNQPNDARRFKLLVPEPTEAQNPATKNYVDTAIANNGGSGGGIPQQTLDQINNNTNNIVDLGNRTTVLETNALSKTTTTPQTIASQITFTQTDMVLKFNSGTNNSAYLAGFKSNNQRVWYFGKGSSTSDNFIIGADSGVIKLEPSTHVDVSNKRIINVADPTAVQDAANKRYVDNLDNQNVKLTGAQTIADTKTFTNQIIANQGLKTAASQTITSGDLELGFGATFAYITPENGDAKALKFSGKQGRGKFDLDMGGASKITNLPEPINDQDAATKNYVDSEIVKVNTGGSIPQQTLDQINTNKTNIATLQSQVNTNTTNITNVTARADTNMRNISSNNSNIVDLQRRTIELETNSLDIYKSTEQVVEGPITFRQRVSAPSSPLRASDLTNKQYVDNQISQIPNGTYNVIFSNPNTFNNLNTLSPINIPSDTALNKPWIIQFDRKGNNGSKYEGTINYAFILPDINQAVFAGNSFWYNSTNKRFENGAIAGITILRTGATTLQFTFQCWDNGNRISNIKLLAPR